MASMRDIKRRKSSISSTQQITKAMKLVSTVKLQKSKAQAEDTKPFFQQMYRTMNFILKRTGTVVHPYLQGNPKGKKAVVLITSNRGLAGGYNANIVKLITNSDMDKEQVLIYAIGHKGKELVERKGYTVMQEDSEIINAPLYSDAMKVCKELLDKFEAGEIGEIYVAYTNFKNTVVHEPTLMKLLPVSVEDVDQADDEEDQTLMNFEPSEEQVLDLIIPKYITSFLYGAFMEALASENGARMQAMDAATSNAQDMIDKLSLQFNRARQGSITQELTEIIAGAESIS